ncbi:MAG TPA: UbiA family prenyltransferase [Crocinitomicaceae bacterium]|nr:UbiA family prenyltransferase [Crocinitomicaceae bacterium]
MLKQLNTYFKFDRWWIPKIAPGVFTYFLFSYLNSNGTTISFNQSTILLFFLLFTLAVFGHFVNDYSDYEYDVKADKINIFRKIKLKYAIPTLILLTIVSAVFAFLINWNVLGLVIIQISFNVFYSLQPFRLKERGWWAMLITGFYERVIPYLIIIFSIITEWNNTLAVFMLIYLLWAYLWECRNFINGQLSDSEDDKKLHLQTLAVVKNITIIQGIKNKLIIIEFIFLLFWSTFLIYTNILFSFVIIAFLTPIIHQFIQRNTTIFKTKESYIDFVYLYTLLPIFILGLIYFDKLHWSFGIIIVAFRSNYLFPTIQTIFTRLYYFLKGITSKIVNYSIYYIRMVFKKK